MKNLLIILSFLFGQYSLTAQCSISNIEVEYGTCNQDEAFFIALNFDYENTSDRFLVENEYLGIDTFEYGSLPVEVGPFPGICSENTPIIVYDLFEESCIEDYNLELVCCGCTIDEVVIDWDACENGVGDWYLTPIGQNMGEDGFNIVVNNQSWTPELIPGTATYVVEGFDLDQPEFTYTICSNASPDCCLTETIENFCFQPNNCELSNLSLDAGPCEDNTTEITINFDYENPGNDFFDLIYQGDVIGFYALSDLPVSIVLESFNNNEVFELMVCINDNDDCCISGVVDNPCYEAESNCEIWDLTVLTECYEEGQLFDAEINFNHSNTTNQFKVFGNGNEYGVYTYAELPITLLGLEVNCNIPYEFIVMDMVYENCMLATDDVVLSCCENAGDCALWDLTVQTECYSSSELFDAEINFNHANTSDLFKVIGNGNEYGVFSYDDLPIILDSLEVQCDLAYEFIVMDLEFEGCMTATDDVSIACCEDNDLCELSNLSIDAAPCIDGLTELTIDFDYTNPGNDFFDLFIEGVFEGFYGLSELPLTIEVANNELEFFDVIACINDNPNCCAIGFIENPCYEVEAECEIWDLTVLTECYEEDQLFDAEINFNFANTSDQFKVVGNGNEYGTFSYSDLPITIEGLEVQCDLAYEFVVMDIGIEGCMAATDDVILSCCDGEGDCELWDLQVFTECYGEGTYFDVQIDFNHANTSDQFKVLGNGNEYGTFSYSDLPIVLDSLEVQCDLNYEFVIMDAGIEGCMIATDDVTLICCEDNDLCGIYNLDVDIAPCVDVTINFDYENPGNDFFDLYIEGVYEGFHALSELPLGLPITSTEVAFFEVVVCINDNPNCCAITSIENPCFEENDDCNIWDLSVTTECYEEGQLFDAEINFNHSNTTNQFKVFGNGNEYGVFTYSDLPVTLSGLEVNCNVQYEFIVMDMVFEDCMLATDDVYLSCCEESDSCTIYDLILNASPCEDGVSEMTIDFEYIEADNDFFDLFIDGAFIEAFLLEDLPVTVVLENTAQPSFDVQVCINDNEDCCNSALIDNPCYELENDCELFDLVVLTECYEEGQLFDVQINFNYLNVGDEFKVLGNGNEYGVFSYLDLPVTISGLEVNCDINYEFVVMDLGSEGCMIATDDVSLSCCEEDESCELWDLTVFTECYEEGTLFDAEVDFNYANTSDAFVIIVNDEVLDTFFYESLPLLFTEIEVNCEATYTIIAQDVSNPECQLILEEVNVDCCEEDESCSLSNLNIETSPCSDESTTEVTIDFEVENPESDFFNITIGNELINEIPLNELPFTFTVSNASDQELDLFICMLESNCCIDGSFENPCYVSSTVEEILKQVDVFQHGNVIQVINHFEDQVSLSLLNISGQLIVQKGVDPSQTIFLETGQIPSGLYFLNMQTAEGTASKKVMIY